MAVITVTTEPVIDPQTHTPSFYDQLVGELLPVLDQIMDIIPKLDEAEPSRRRASGRGCSRRTRSAPTPSTPSSRSPSWRRRRSSIPPGSQLQFLVAFRPLEHKLVSTTRRVTHALRAVKSDVGTRSLQIYRIAQDLASDQRSPGVSAHLEAMKRDLGRRASTKAAREQRKAEKIEATIQAEVEKRVEAALELRLKEVKAA